VAIRVVIAEDEKTLRDMYNQIDEIFGLNESESKFPARWKALSRHESDQPELKKLQINLKAPFSGSVDDNIRRALGNVNLTCRVRIEGPNIVEGLKQMASSNGQLILPSEDSSQKIGLPDFLQNLHSLAKSQFSFDFTTHKDEDGD